MTTTASKAPAKAKAAKSPVATEAKAKVAKAKPVAAKSEAKKAPSQAADGFIKVTQMVGSIGRQRDQEATLKGLGLNKRHRSKVLENTPSVRGMIYKVRHLVKTEKVS